MPSTFSSSHRPNGSQSSSDLHGTASNLNLLQFGSPLSSFPKALTDQMSTELYELIIEGVGPDKRSLLACSLVCRSWVPRSKYLLQELMVCHPVPLVSHGGIGTITCAVSPHQGSSGGIIYGTTDGVYRGSPDGSRARLLSIRDVSQIEILSDSNLFLCVAGGLFVTVPLSTIYSGTATKNDMTRPRGGSSHASCFTVHRGIGPAEIPRVGVLVTKRTLSGTIVKIFDVRRNNLVSVLVLEREFYSSADYHSVRFLTRTRMAGSIKQGSAVQGGFERVELPTFDMQSLLDPTDPALIELPLKEYKPITVFQVDDVFLVCYDKVAFYIDRRGDPTRKELVMQWTQPSNAFALHQPYILAFCDMRVEVWNIETAEKVQKIQGPYYLLNNPDSGGTILSTSLTTGDVTEMVFHERGT
ncbi:CNH domain-containing protein [Mycena polygramma]|nr:CNH domain-containing protein [Mycena polygramma]